MKRSFLLFVLAAIFALLAGCAAYVGTPIMGGLFTNVTAPVTFDPGAQGQKYQILGTVEGTSHASNVFGIIATGDASIYSAYKAAMLKYPNADDLIDITIDYKGHSILGLFGSYTTIVRAKAIKRITEE